MKIKLRGKTIYSRVFPSRLTKGKELNLRQNDMKLN